MAASDGVDRRNVALGVVGFCYCEESDVATRLKVSEAVQFGGLDALSPRRAHDAPILSPPRPQKVP